MHRRAVPQPQYWRMPVPVEPACLGRFKVQDARPDRQASGGKTATASNGHTYSEMHRRTFLGPARQGLPVSCVCACVERQDVLPAHYQTRTCTNDALLQWRALLGPRREILPMPVQQAAMGRETLHQARL